MTDVLEAAAPVEAPAKKAVVKKAVAKVVENLMVNFSATGGKKDNARFAEVDAKKVHVLKGFNPRKKFDNIDGLAGLIKANGLANAPTVRPDPEKEGHYWIVAGERRYRAVNQLGWEKIPVTIRDDLAGPDNDLKALALAGAENDGEGRQELTPLERGALYQSFADQGWSVKKIAANLTAHDRDVRRCIDLHNAPEAIQKKVEKGELGFVAALEMAALDEDTQKKVFDHFKKTGAEISAAAIKQVAKSGAVEAGEEPAKGKKKGKGKGGASSPAGLVAWKGGKAKSLQLSEMCYLYVNAIDAEVGSTNYHEVRGVIGCLFWERGDIAYPKMPPLDPAEALDPANAKKELKRLQAMIEAEALKHTPDDGDDAAAGKDPEDPDAAAFDDSGDDD